MKYILHLWDLNLKGFINQYLFYEIVGPTWFLKCMFFAELLFLLLLIINNDYIYYGYIACGLIVCYLVNGSEEQIFVIIGRIAFAAIFLVIGYKWKSLFINAKMVPSMISLLIVFCISTINTDVNMYVSLYGCLPLYFISSLIGSYGIIGVSKMIPTKSLPYIGNNTLPIIGTHVLYIRFYEKCFNIENKYVGFICIVLFVTVLEWISICVLNRYLPITVGKKVFKTHK